MPCLFEHRPSLRFLHHTQMLLSMPQVGHVDLYHDTCGLHCLLTVHLAMSLNDLTQRDIPHSLFKRCKYEAIAHCLIDCVWGDDPCESQN